MKTCLALGAALQLATALSAHAADTTDDERPAIAPYRPSVSTPAQWSAPGCLERKAGGLRATGGGVRLRLRA